MEPNAVKRIAMRFVTIAVLIVLVFLHLSTNLLAASKSERESLRGLQGVEPIIEKLTAEAKADGLSEDSIRTAVELILRSSGIRVLEGTTPPLLYIQVRTVKSKGGSYLVNLDVELEQLVSLIDPPGWSGYGTTWKGQALGSFDAHKMREIIPFIESMVKGFANDFLTANPK